MCAAECLQHCKSGRHASHSQNILNALTSYNTTNRRAVRACWTRVRDSFVAISQCINCRIDFLSVISFEDLVCHYGVNANRLRANTRYPFRFYLCTLLYRCLPFHLKMRKIMAKSFMRNRHCFDILCNFLILELSNTIKSAWFDNDVDDGLFASGYIFENVFFMSIKYWSKPLLLRFGKKYARRLMAGYRQCIAQDRSSDEYARNSMRARICSEVMDRFMRSLPVEERREYDPEGEFMVAVETRRSNMEYARFNRVSIRCLMSCCCNDCRNPGYMYETSHKLCGGCKMAYYCSRSCQKRAWLHHKQECQKLKMMNAL